MIETSREHEPAREKHLTYSRPDRELIEIRSPFSLSKGIPKELIKIQYPPLEAMKDGDEPKELKRKEIKVKNERNTSKATKKKPRKNNTKSK